MTKKVLEYSKLPDRSFIYSSKAVSVYHKPGYIIGESPQSVIDCGVVESEKFSYVVSYFSDNNPTYQQGVDLGLRLTKIIFEWFAQEYSS
jgi:hypothetical protein